MNKNYDFANISANQIDELNELQKKFSQEGKEIVLIAFEKKFVVADVTEAELDKIHSLEKELSTEDKEMVLIAFSKEK